MYHLAEMVRDARRDMDERVATEPSSQSSSSSLTSSSPSASSQSSSITTVSTWAAYTPLPFLYSLAQQISQTMQRKAPDLVKRAAVLTRDQIAHSVTSTQHAVHEFRVVTTRRGQVLFYTVKSTVETVPLPSPVEPLRSHLCVPVLNGVEGFAQFVTSEELPELYFVAKTSMTRHVVLRHLVLPPLAAAEKVMRYLVILPTQIVFPSREEIESRTDVFLNVSTSRVQSLVEYIYSATEVLDQHWSMVQWNILGRGPYESLVMERRQDVMRSIFQRVRIIESRFKLYEFMASVKLQNEMLYGDLLRAFPLTSGVPLLENEIRGNEQLQHELESYDEDAFPCWFYRKIELADDASTAATTGATTTTGASTTTPTSSTKWIEFPAHENRRLERHYRFYLRQKKLHGGPLPTPIVVVDEGRHEVNMETMTMAPVYWPAMEKMEVRRSMWLYAQRNYGLAPYNPPAAQVLEQAFTYYLAYYEEERQRLLDIALKRRDRNAARTATMGCTMSVPVEGHLVEFKGPHDMMQYKRLLAGTTPFTSKRRVYRGDPRIRADPKTLELWKRGMVVSDTRGVVPNDDDADLEAAVDHLVLIVHGIGDALKTIDIINVVTLRSIVDCAASLRSLHKEALRSSHFDKLGETRPRTEFLPIEWHSKLHIEGLDQAIRDVTLPAIPKLREFANDTILDVLFFMSPMFHRVILDHVATEMNRVYGLFQSRHRGWEHGTGRKKKVSIIAHSLGSIISFDVLNHQPPRPQRPVKMPTFHGDPITESTEDESETEANHHVELLDSDSDSNESTDNANGFDAMVLDQLHERSRSDSECVRARHLLQTTSTGRAKPPLPPKSQPNGLGISGHGRRATTNANGVVVQAKKHVSVGTKPTSTRTTARLRRRASKPVSARIPSSSSTTTRSSRRKTASSSPPPPPRRRKRSRGMGGGSKETTMSDVPGVPVLLFSVDNLFCFGSPVGLFLNVRGQQIARDFKLPTCKRVFNIYHPYDPVAYRIEPILNPRRAHSKAAIIRTFEGKLRFQYQLRNSFRRMWQKLRQWRRNFETQVESTVRSVGLVETAALVDHDSLATTASPTEETLPSSAIPSGRMLSTTEREDGEYGTGRRDLFGRLCQGLPIDYSLQENEIEIANEYLFALTSHVIYWGNRDASLFVAQKMILEPPVESDNEEEEEDDEQDGDEYLPSGIVFNSVSSGSISPAFSAFPSRPASHEKVE